MSFELSALHGLLIVAAFWLIATPFLKRERNSHREIISLLTFAVGLRYLAWRGACTVIGDDETTLLEQAWTVFLYAVELLAFGEICIFLLVMSKTNTRSAEADSYEAKLDSFPSVDVFIPTYNEGLDVLEKTIVGAMHLDYPNFKVWVLDDGKRDWLKEFCEHKKVGYLRRPDNKHAKAGNLNNGLKHTSGELFAIMDADFIPARNFLKRTVGFFVFNGDMGIVQTPQHFFNRDPIQSNLYLHKAWPDEQRLFFDVIAPSRDSWGAAFCCGSCSIARRQAVELAGGIPTSSITEDILTTLCLLKVGYRTVYLNEKLSQGLSAESLSGYFIQRSRWCRGGIQCMFVPEGPLRAKWLSPFQRLLFAPYGWIAQPVTRLLLLLVPVVYLWTGMVPMFFTSGADIISYQLPMLLMCVMAIHWLAPKRYVPLLSTAVGVFSMFRLLPVVISSLIKPFGEPFRVTPKGSASHVGVDNYTLTASLLLIFLIMSGILVNLVPEYRVLTQLELYPYALAWSILDVCILAICVLLCFDAPRKRQEERFISNERSCVCGVELTIHDISLGGCKAVHKEGKRIAERGETVEIPIPGIERPFKAEVKNANASELMCQFKEMEEGQRDQLIVKLFTGAYNNGICEYDSAGSVVRSLLARAFGKELK